MLRPSPNHGTQRLPNDDDDDGGGGSTGSTLIGLVHMIHLMAMSRSFVLCPAGWQQLMVIASSVMKRRELSVRYMEVLTVHLSVCCSTFVRL